MSANTGNGFRRGSVTERSQTFNLKTDPFMKRNDGSGRFMGAKGTPYKEVAREPDCRKHR